MKFFIIFLPLLVAVFIWQTLGYVYPEYLPLFSSPSKIIFDLCNKLFYGDLLYHIAITAFEAFMGLFLGMLVGSVVGFLFTYFPHFSNITRPYIVVLSSVPTFALAPLMIIWFGTGIGMKVALSFFATVFITIFQVYEGSKKISRVNELYFLQNKATNTARFNLLVFPAAFDWLIQSIKLNAGFCILGAFIGEFIASEAGLGYIILKSSALYDITGVFSSIICIITLTLLFNYLAKLLEGCKVKLIRFFSI